MAWEGASKDCRNWAGDYRSAHFAAYLACLVADSEAYLGPLHEEFPEASLAAYPEASLADEPYVEMHDKMAESCLNPDAPCCSPFRSQIVVVVGDRHCKRDEESRDAEIRGEETHDVT